MASTAGEDIESEADKAEKTEILDSLM